MANKSLVRIIPNKWINQARYDSLRTHFIDENGLPLCKKTNLKNTHYEYIDGTKATCKRCQAIEEKELRKTIKKLINRWEKEIRINVEKESKHSPRLQKMPHSEKLKHSYWKIGQIILDELKEVIDYED